MTTLVIAPRFRGPPDSGNGGYVCGIIAAAIGSPVCVRLKHPPPLDTPMTLERDEDGHLWRLLNGDTVVAEARPDHCDIDVPRPPDRAEAESASLRYMGFIEHPFPGCFVCGPRRPADDGLRIFTGPLTDGTLVAAPWVPDASLAGPDGLVRPEFLWAALDCPGYFATPLAGKRALLGELSVRIERPLRPGAACVVTGWKRHAEGRKHFVGTAVFGPDGVLAARAAATWIALAS